MLAGPVLKQGHRRNRDRAHRGTKHDQHRNHSRKRPYSSDPHVKKTVIHGPYKDAIQQLGDQSIINDMTEIFAKVPTLGGKTLRYGIYAGRSAKVLPTISEVFVLYDAQFDNR